MKVEYIERKPVTRLTVQQFEDTNQGTAFVDELGIVRINMGGVMVELPGAQDDDFLTYEWDRAQTCYPRGWDVISWVDAKLVLTPIEQTAEAKLVSVWKDGEPPRDGASYLVRNSPSADAGIAQWSDYPRGKEKTWRAPSGRRIALADITCQWAEIPS